MNGQSWLFVKASWTRGSSFLIENRDGSRITLEIRKKEKGKENCFAPVEGFIASLGACAGINVIMMLQDEGLNPESFTVKVECLVNNTTPRIIEKIHLIFLVSGMIEDPALETIISQVMTLMCPIAVTVGKATAVTWEQTISRPS